MKGHLKIVFHNPNTQEKTAEYIWDILVDMLIDKVNENPEMIFEMTSLLIGGDESENSSLL